MPENVNVINKELIPSVESLARENKKGEGEGEMEKRLLLYRPVLSIERVELRQ